MSEEKTFEDKYDIRDKNLHTVLANGSNHSRARFQYVIIIIIILLISIAQLSI